MEASPHALRGMDIAQEPSPPPARAADTARTTETPRAAHAGRIAIVILAVAGVIAWEVSRPSLPVPFELALASHAAAGIPAWLARLPMAVITVIASVAIWTFLARLVDRGAGT